MFIFSKDSSYGGCFGSHVTLHPTLKSPEGRTAAVGDVIKCMAEKELIPGIRNEVLLVMTEQQMGFLFLLLCAAVE